MPRRAAALPEVLGGYLVGPVIMQGLRRVFGISLINPLNQLTAYATRAELVTASRQLLVLSEPIFIILVCSQAFCSPPSDSTGLCVDAISRSGDDSHAVFDIPLSTVWQGVLPAGLLVGAAVIWRRAVPVVKQVFSTGSGTAGVALGAIGAGYAALTSVDRTIVCGDRSLRHAAAGDLSGSKGPPPGSRIPGAAVAIRRPFDPFIRLVGKPG